MLRTSVGRTIYPSKVVRCVSCVGAPAPVLKSGGLWFAKTKVFLFFNELFDYFIQKRSSRCNQWHRFPLCCTPLLDCAGISKVIVLPSIQLRCFSCTFFVWRRPKVTTRWCVSSYLELLTAGDVRIDTSRTSHLPLSLASVGSLSSVSSM